MDPISQATVGAILPQSQARKGEMGAASWAGLLGGMAADLDAFITSTVDPLLTLQYHRHFTHSLIFIPVGGLLVSSLLYPFLKEKLSWRRLYTFTTLGYGTHGLLDACTSYGTLLLWPFSKERISWNIISFVDPLFTLPLLALMILAWKTRKRGYAKVALVYGFFYLMLGLWQRERATAEGLKLAQARGHQVEHITADPSFGNIVLWKVIYETRERFYADAVRLRGSAKLTPGTSLPKLRPERDLPWLDPASQQARDLARFRWFSQDYLALSPKDPHTVIDVRYSHLPHQMEGLWGITFNPTAGAEEHVGFETFVQPDEKTRAQFWELLHF